MAELWRDLVELLRRRPALWLPVLVADLLCYLIGLGRAGLLRIIILRDTAQQSVFGGAVVHSMTAGAMKTTTIAALLLSWLTYFLRMLLYASAFAATAALIEAFAERASKPASTIGPTLVRLRGGILELALRGLAVYAVAALILSSLTPTLVKSGHAALLRNSWFNFSLSFLVALILSAMLAPAGLRVLAGRTPGKTLTRVAQQFSLTVLAVATLLASFVAANGREMAQVPAGARYPLEIVGSLLVALPYVLLFTGIALLARQLAKENADAASIE